MFNKGNKFITAKTLFYGCILAHFKIQSFKPTNPTNPRTSKHAQYKKEDTSCSLSNIKSVVHIMLNSGIR
eukprot:scaffold51154_cov58-Cyclotella_meneghiniana.AAC.2